MKNIIITSGPTNEKIDAVMKITNMSTGALGAAVADSLAQFRLLCSVTWSQARDLTSL